MVKTKVCIKCGVEKLLTEFCKRTDSPDGYHRYCRTCNKAEHAAYHEKNRTRELKRMAKYNKSPKSKAAHKANKIKRRAAGELTTETMETVRQASNGICPYCGKRIEEGHIDHIIPISKGGTSSPDNLAWVCASCNLSKSNRSLDEFLKELGRFTRGKHQ